MRGGARGVCLDTFVEQGVISAWRNGKVLSRKEARGPSMLEFRRQQLSRGCVSVGCDTAKCRENRCMSRSRCVCVWCCAVCVACLRALRCGLDCRAHAGLPVSFGSTSCVVAPESKGTKVNGRRFTYYVACVSPSSTDFCCGLTDCGINKCVCCSGFCLLACLNGGFAVAAVHCLQKDPGRKMINRMHKSGCVLFCSLWEYVFFSPT